MTGKSKKKILYIITKSVWAGAGKYVYDLATGLPSVFEVHVACGGDGPLAQKLKNAGIPCHNIKNFQRDVNVFKDILAYFELFKLYLKIRPDIIHANSSKAASIAGAAAFDYRFLALNLKLKTIFTAHGWAFNEPRPAFQKKLIKFFSKLTCLFYNKIICVSEFDRQAALKNKIAPSRKLLTIHNGVKNEDYEFLTKEKARQKLSASGEEKEIWIGTIGEFTKNKGHKFLIEAVKKLVASGYPLTTIIIGFGEEFENLKMEIKNWGMEEKIFLINNHESPANFLKAFDIFVFPSLKEGFPYALLEAGLARLAVVATEVGGIPEIVMHEETGLLVKPADSAGLAEAIEKIANDPNLRSTLSFALWEKTNRDFSFKKMLNSTLAAYEINSASGKNN
ncbi:glycosyltransferase family 4 protein [Patescibacteria group bacterium]|nr:glycosyltransferase family 4 protein [Patescibacteria group bacterium]